MFIVVLISECPRQSLGTEKPSLWCYPYTAVVHILMILFIRCKPIFLLQVSILHIVHFAGLDLGKPRHREHCHTRIPMLAPILL